MVFMRNLSLASGLSKKNTTIFTKQDVVYKFWSSNQKFPETLSIFKIYHRLWCMAWDFVDKLASQNNLVK